jgi:hypothetical protein
VLRTEPNPRGRIRLAVGAALILVVASFGSIRASAAVETLTFAAAADASIKSNLPTTNFGRGTKLEVDGKPVKDYVIRFDVSGVGARTVTSAKLRLFCLDASPMGGAFHRVADASWGERTVTWQAAPVADAGTVATLGAVSANTWHEIDLTSFVTGDGSFSLRVTSSSANNAVFSSRETAAAPQLVLTLNSTSDTSPPLVAITSPTDGATVAGTTGVVVSASDDTRVAAVDLAVDGSVRLTDTTEPFGFSWDTTTTTNGDHTLTTVARDPAGNATTSAPVQVTVANVNDTKPPDPPTGLAASAPSFDRVELTWTASSDDVGVAGYRIVRDGVEVGSSSTTSFTDRSVLPVSTYHYRVVAVDAAGNASTPSDEAVVTTPPRAASVSFAAAGDHGANSGTAASLAALDGSGVAFYLALGDLDYDQVNPDSAWCDYVKTRLPTLGPTFPFELVVGNHEEQGGPNGYILNHAACLPDRLGSTLSPTQRYAAEYYFDYPASSPLVRVVMIAPDLTVENVTYDYVRGNARYQWLAGAIDGARAAGIPWVVVGMHKVCLSEGGKTCEIGTDLQNLLVEKKVDLVLQGHEHMYQRTHQLALDPATCPTIPAGSFDADCVHDDGQDGRYPKGAGTVFLVDGTFGRESLDKPNPTDAEAPYFVVADGTTFGFTKYTVTSTRLEGRFVNSVGSFTDSFAIEASTPPDPDPNPPVANDVAVTTMEETPVTIQLSGSDAERCELMFSIVSGPGHGSLNGLNSAPCHPGSLNTDMATIRYTPEPNHAGSDSFTFWVSDGTPNAALGTAAVSVTPVNDPPTAIGMSRSTGVDAPVTIPLSGTDAETCELAFSIVSAPTHGGLGGLAGEACTSGAPNTDRASVTYMPASGFSGVDSFTYQVSDGVASSVATVNVSVGGAPPAITLLGASSAANPTGTSLTIDRPAGVTAGSVLLAGIDVRGSPTIVPPAGWTLVRADQNPTLMKQAVYVRVVGGEEPASYTWSFSNIQAAAGGITAYSGVAVDAPVDAHSGLVTATTSAAITAPSITTSSNGAAVVAFFGVTGSTSVTPPLGTVERWDLASNAGTYKITSAGATLGQDVAGSTGDLVASAANAGRSIGQLVALRPA